MNDISLNIETALVERAYKRMLMDMSTGMVIEISDGYQNGQGVAYGIFIQMVRKILMAMNSEMIIGRILRTADIMVIRIGMITKMVIDSLL